MHIDDARIIVNSMDGNIWYLDEANKRVIKKATDGIAVRTTLHTTFSNNVPIVAKIFFFF